MGPQNGRIGMYCCIMNFGPSSLKGGARSRRKKEGAAMNAKEQDRLYSWLNTRGRKSFKPTEKARLAERFPEYAKLGLPAHKAAIEGDVEALKEIYTSTNAQGVPSRDVNGATPLHLAVRSNRLEAVK